MNSGSSSSDIATMDFEDALTELEDVVRQLEGGRIRLEEAVTAYEWGVKLKRHCETKLKEARAKVERITAGPEGQVITALMEGNSEGNSSWKPSA